MDEDPLLSRDDCVVPIDTVVRVNNTSLEGISLPEQRGMYGMQSLRISVEQQGKLLNIREILAPPILHVAPEQRQEIINTMSRTTTSIHCVPGMVMTWEQFCQMARERRKTYPIDIVLVVHAVDGLVKGPSAIVREPGLLIVSSDHHSPLDPPGTESASLQVAEHITMRSFEDPSMPAAPIHIEQWADDPDQDVSTCYALLRDAASILSLGDKALRRLDRFLRLQNELDKRMALLPLNPNSTLLRQMAWVYQPYMELRRSNGLHAHLDGDGVLVEQRAADMERVIVACADRFRALAEGHAEEMEVDTHAEWIYEDESWGMVDEFKSGEFHRIGVCNEGERRFFVSMRNLENGRYAYSVARIGEDIVSLEEQPLDADLTEFFVYMNKVDTVDREGDWGGNYDKGGSPRIAGTTMNPELFSWHFNLFLNQARPPVRYRPPRYSLHASRRRTHVAISA